MRVNGKHFQSIWFDETQQKVFCIDQTTLPHAFTTIELDSLESSCIAISTMQVRGAPLIGVTAAYGMYLALKADPNCYIEARARLLATRPTAVNLQWALSRVDQHCAGFSSDQLAFKSLQIARQLEADDISTCEAIGENGAEKLMELWQKKGGDGPLNVLTHCNAGWLATVDWGTALSVIYKAHEQGVPLHVWVDETRPRNQGASLSCWELTQHGIANTLIVDNAGGHLMQHGQVDVCVVGSDRTTRCGDVCNKIGTYLKALAAFDNHVPFYAALPISTIDFELSDGVAEIPIEERSGTEISHLTGLTTSGDTATIQIVSADTQTLNIGFDVTPAKYISGIITESGVHEANEIEISALRPI